jgi:hypothetical protein
VDDVYLDNGYLRVTTRASGRVAARGTKTGRERNVPIERRVLLPILAAWVQKQKNAGSPWLFPALNPDGLIKRTKTPDGVWSDNGVWHDYWTAARVRLGVVGKPHYDYGPAKWRHTAGTAMGHSGLSSLQISRNLGNSEDVANRHYVARLAPGKCWPLRWS